MHSSCSNLADGEERLFSADVDELAVSAGVLHLLRSATTDDAPNDPIAEHLIPCCAVDR